jgi:glucokinase
MIDLLADIGGTNARVAFRKGSAPFSRVFLRRSAAFDSLAALLSDVITEAGAKPERAVVAVPGPVGGPLVRLTNLPWEIDQRGLAAALGIGAVRIVNDLEAVAWSLPHLGRGDLVTWRVGTAAPEAARVVVAPGTGFGVSALVPTGGGWAAVPSEGGHARAAMPPATPDALRPLWRTAPCWEDLLSGGGLLRLYAALGGRADAPADVTARGARKEAPALEAIGFFSELLGGCAGDMAIIFDARGGCFVAGGVVPALGGLFDVARFVAGFSDKGRYAPYASAIPLALISHPYPAFPGLAALVEAISPAPSP